MASCQAIFSILFNDCGRWREGITTRSKETLCVKARIVLLKFSNSKYCQHRGGRAVVGCVDKGGDELEVFLGCFHCYNITLIDAFVKG